MMTTNKTYNIQSLLFPNRKARINWVKWTTKSNLWNSSQCSKKLQEIQW